MANLFYDPINAGADMQLYKDPQVLIRSDMEQARDAILDIQGLPTALRTEIAVNGLLSIGNGAASIPSFNSAADPLTSLDAHIATELDRLHDILDYFDYDSGSAGLTVRTIDHFLPEALESVSHEEVGFEGVNAIDAVGGGDPDPNDPRHSTYWQSEAAGLRTIVFRLRGYKKKLEGIRLRATSGGDGRSQLQGVTIKASARLASIDDPGNVMSTGVNFTFATNWMEHLFAAAKFNARYIKLEVSSSLHSNTDHVRIRSIQGIVGILSHR